MKILKGLLASLLLISGIAKADRPATHGMLLFGDQVTYASHLPMFHAPHDYQLIMKLELLDVGKLKTLEKYKQAKLQGTMLFTLVPEIMDLSKVIDGSKKSFSAEVFAGHFERGGQNLGQVLVKVSKITYSAKLAANQLPSQPFQNESYLLFGEAGEYFGAHLIKGKPSFDAVVSVSQPTKMLNVPCNRRNCPDPIAVPITDSQLPLTVRSSVTAPASGDFLGSPFKDVHATVKTSIYYEEDELSQ